MKAKSLAQIRHKRGNLSDDQAKVHTITSDGNPELTPLDLAVPSAEPGMLCQSTVQERETSHVETRGKAGSTSMSLLSTLAHTPRAAKPRLSQVASSINTWIQLRSNKSSGPSLTAAWKSLPSAKQARFSRSTVLTPSHAVQNHQNQALLLNTHTTVVTLCLRARKLFP